MSNSLEEIPVRGHEQVSIFQDETVGLTAIIAVHSNALGPAIGGCRMRVYPTIDEAVGDALRLAEGMSYKNSLAGLNFGGGKSVIIKDSRSFTKGRSEFFQAFGRQVEKLGGRYLTAEDMGTSVSDMMEVLKVTKHVVGKDPSSGGSGDPSPWTARGTFDGILACLERVYGSDNLNGRHVAIQGVGAVGGYLAKHLAEAGARLTICDPFKERLDSIAKETGAEIVGVGDIYGVECDVFAPCAAGGIINELTIPSLKCKIIAGAANNQMVNQAAEKQIVSRGIVYAPDFAINAGGVINCAAEKMAGGYNVSWVKDAVSKIRATVGRIVDEAKTSGELPGDIAMKLAKKRISEANASRPER